MKKEEIVARIRRYHVEYDDDLSAIFDAPHVKSNHPHAELKILLAFNSAVKRLNDCYAAHKPNHAHIARALRDALKYAHDMDNHRVANHMPQGVETLERNRPLNMHYATKEDLLYAEPRREVEDSRKYPITPNYLDRIYPKGGREL